MRRALVPIMAVAVLAAAGAAAWALLDRPVAVTTAKATRGPAVELIYATGFVEPEHPVTVSSRILAPVVAVLADEGDAVARGQPLVRLDDSEQRALLDQARAEATARTLAETRTVTLFREGWVTKAARDEAVAAAASARAALDAVTARLDQMTVRAGIAGVVLKREVEPGDLASPGVPLFELGDPARALVNATVDERDIARVQPGQRALLSSDALPARTIAGHVAQITPGGDPTVRAFRVKIAVDDAVALPFGLTLEVNIVARRHLRALLVPAAALDGNAVWLVRGDRVERRPVRTGIAGTDRVEILSGLDDGATVVVAPPAGLADGDRVRVR